MNTVNLETRTWFSIIREKKSVFPPFPIFMVVSLLVTVHCALVYILTKAAIS